jgi:threonine/homoserine/homoserine lactone efflux protein
MLVTPRVRVNGPISIIGWLAGLAVIGAIGLTVAGAAGASNDEAPSNGANLFEIVLGVVLLLFAVRQWSKRTKPDQEPKMPNWMSAVEDFSPTRAAGMGVMLSAVNPKSLILTLAAATSIAATGLPGTDQVLAFALYVLIATIGVAVPVVVYYALGDRSQPLLGNLKTWLGHNNAAIMSVIFAVMGAKVLGQGIAG